MLNSLEQLTSIGEITQDPEQLGLGWTRVERFLINHCHDHQQIDEYVTLCKQMRTACDCMLMRDTARHYLALVHADYTINIKPVLQVIDEYDGQFMFVKMMRIIKEIMHKRLDKDNIEAFKQAINTVDDWEFIVSNFDY